MSDVTYKIRVNRPCRLFIDDEEVMILEESKLAKINLPEGEYLRKVVAIDNSAIFDEAEIMLSGASKLDIISLDTYDLSEVNYGALPNAEFQVGGFYYKSTEGGKSVMLSRPVKSDLASVLIPEHILYGGYQYKVEAIENYAFCECSLLSSITFSHNIKRIGRGAFKDCVSLSDVNFADGIETIEGWAFAGCKTLTSIILPSSVISVGDSTFNGCTSLIHVVIPNTIDSFEFALFNDCTALTSFMIPDSVKTIKGDVFCGCTSLNSINIPQSILSIGDGAFHACSSLHSVTIPNNVIHIGWRAFSWCTSLASINLSINLKTIGKGAFQNCNSLPFIDVPNGVTAIGDNAFSGCTKLLSMHIPKSVHAIGNGAFSGCSSLCAITVDKANPIYDSRNNCNAIIETATNTLVFGYQKTIIPPDVRIIGDSAFMGCIYLGSILIPNSVERIKKHAFRDCRALTSINIPINVCEIEEWAFAGCYSLVSISVDTNNSIYESHVNCNAIIESATHTLIFGNQNTIIPNGVTSIGKNAFYDCSSITIPSNVTHFSEYIFSGCFELLTSITYLGTMLQWDLIEKSQNWNMFSSINIIHCTDGDIRID